jgi:hypothetical protein
LDEIKFKIFKIETIFSQKNAALKKRNLISFYPNLVVIFLSTGQTCPHAQTGG